MKQYDSIAYRKLPLRGGAGAMPALGFGTLIPDATETRNATRTALETGFRHLDCSERYRNEEQVGGALVKPCRPVGSTAVTYSNDEAVEQQSSPGASPACDRVEP